MIRGTVAVTNAWSRAQGAPLSESYVQVDPNEVLLYMNRDQVEDFVKVAAKVIRPYLPAPAIMDEVAREIAMAIHADLIENA